MIPKVKIVLLFSAAVLLLFVMGCSHESDDIPTGLPASVDYFLGTGWDSFMDGNYSAALADFNEAASRDASETEAYLGIAWCYLRLQQYNLAKSNAQSVLSDVIYNANIPPAELDRYRAEAYACIASAYQGLYAGDLSFTEQAILFADSCLAVDPNFVFTYDPDVNAQSLVITKANAYFAASDFINAFTTITALPHDPSIYAATIDTIIDDDFPLSLEIIDAVAGMAELTIQDTLTVDTVIVDTVTLDTTFTYTYYFDIQLVDVFSVSRVVSGNTVDYFIEDFVQGSNIIHFYGVPLPQVSDQFLVSYVKSPDYSQFLIALRELIDSF